MNAARLLALYERVADAPDAVARLRRFVLDLAVQGKLVEQDATDEPATELLKRVVAERARLVKAGEIREPRNSLKIKRCDLPFSPPVNWVWARLIDIARPGYGAAFNPSQINGEKRGMPLIRIGDISKADTEAYYEGEYDSLRLVRAGDYLVRMSGYFNLHRWRGPEALLNHRVMRIYGWRCEIEPEFVKMPLQMVLDYLHGVTSLTTVKNLTAKQVNGIEIPLPPLAEQHRIVAKVDELMALLDRLEAARNARETARDQLTTAAFARLTSPDTAPGALPAHSRFALDNLVPLTARPHQIGQLRKTILNLAVQGKLVEQDEADEPAASLLKRIALEKARLADLGRRKQNIGPPIAVDEEIKLPNGWVAVYGFDLFPTRTSNSKLIKGRLHAEPADGLYPGFSASGQDVWLDDWDHEGDAIILSAVGARCGKAFLATGKWSAVSNTHIIWLLIGVIEPVFALICLDNENFWLRSGGAQPFVKVKATLKRPFPLPPLAEQQRIVARVDELMALCDQLEAALGTAETTRENLLEALLHESLMPEEVRDTAA